MLVYRTLSAIVCFSPFLFFVIFIYHRHSLWRQSQKKEHQKGKQWHRHNTKLADFSYKKLIQYVLSDRGANFIFGRWSDVTLSHCVLHCFSFFFSLFCASKLFIHCVVCPMDWSWFCLFVCLFLSTAFLFVCLCKRGRLRFLGVLWINIDWKVFLLFALVCKYGTRWFLLLGDIHYYSNSNKNWLLFRIRRFASSVSSYRHSPMCWIFVLIACVCLLHSSSSFHSHVCVMIFWSGWFYFCSRF